MSMFRVLHSAIFILLALIGSTACNLETATLETPTASPEIVILTKPPTTAPTNLSATDVPTEIPPTATTVIQVGDCIIPGDWIPYTVVGGDNMYRIAGQYESTVEELVATNCMTNANQIVVGQVIYVPGAGSANNALGIYLIAPDGEGQGDGGGPGIWVGCGGSAVLQETGLPVSDNVAANIRTALEYLLTLDPVAVLPADGSLASPLSEQDLTVRNVTLEGSRVTIQLQGSIQLVGACADALLESQLLLAAFHDPQIDSARINIGERNARQIFDMSGLAGPDSVYTRDKLLWSGS